MQDFEEAPNSRYIYQNQLNKACFQHDMTHGDFKDLTGRAASDKILLNKAFNIASMVYTFFEKKTSGSGIKHEIISNKELAEELQKTIIRYFKKKKVHSTFIDNIWSVDFAGMHVIGKFNEGFLFLLCVTDIYSKY